jgi:hypothetical protein
MELLPIVSEYGEQVSRASLSSRRLGGKRYAENWLEHLLVSGSMNGVEMDQQMPL